MSVILPHDLDAEQALLGSILIDPQCFHKLRIGSGDFYDHRHRRIFEAMRALVARQDAIDYRTLVSELRHTGGLAEVGGEAAIMGLAVNTPSSLHTESYARIVSEASRRRKIIAVASEVAKQAYDPQSNLDEAIARAASDLVMAAGGKSGSRPFWEVLSELYDQIKLATQNPRDVFGIPTGLAGFDRITGGLQRKEVFMLSGEPGVGKSFLAMQLAVGAAEGSNGIPGTPGAVYQLEMSEIAVARRTLSERSRVEARRLRSGRVNADEWQQITEAMEKLSMLPIYIADESEWTTLDLRVDLARLKERGVGWVVIDYMGLLKDAPLMTETERMGVISDRVHAIAKDLDVSIIAVHDMTKGAQTGEVKGQVGLAGHRRVGYNADMTAFLKKSGKTDGLYRLEWEKFREDSPERVLQLRRVPGFPAYAEVERQPEPVTRSSGRRQYPDVED